MDSLLALPSQKPAGPNGVPTRATLPARAALTVARSPKHVDRDPRRHAENETMTSAQARSDHHRSEPRARARPLVAVTAPIIVAAVLACGVLSTSAAARPLQTVLTFDPAARETPENLAIDRDGTIYVSLAFASEIRRLSPYRSQTTLSIPTMGGITVGLAIDRHHHDDLAVAVRSGDPAAAGIWRVSRDSFADPARIAALPPSSFPNGIAFDSAGNLYVADSNLGVIWRIARGSAQATIWSESALLAPTGAGFMNFPLPGANGIKVRGHLIYVSNTSTQNILTIPILRDGDAGKPEIRFTGIQADDFAFASTGDLLVTENPLSKLVRVTPDGEITTVATHADGLANPSAVAFDPRPHRRSNLYITNSAYFGTHPSLQVTTVDQIGQRQR